MRTLFFAVLALSFNCSLLSAVEKTDSLKIRDDVYKEEQGFFMKAYRDASDPTFMITDSKGNFSIGIGGLVMASAYYDFNGSIDSPYFETSSIGVPSDKANHFGYTADGSNIHVKAKSHVGKLKLASYLEFQSATDLIYLAQGYVSVGDFTIGKTYSFFSDLEAGLRTVDLRGANMQVDNIHPLVGFTHSFNNGFKFGVSLEQPTEISSLYNSYGIDAQFSRYPDLVGYVKYSGKLGHVQLGGILREQGWASCGTSNYVEKSFYKNCYGLSFGGTLKPVEGLKISGVATVGRGISRYIKELKNLDADMFEEAQATSDGYPILSPAPVYGGYIGAGYMITPRMEASALAGYCHLGKDDTFYSATDFKSSVYCTVNVVYFLSNSCCAGIEYANGKKTIYTTSSVDSGSANRFNACFIYTF